MEKQYVDDGFPTDFPVVAPFLADIDTSGGRGQIYYRVTETPSVLNRVAQVCMSIEYPLSSWHSCYPLDPPHIHLSYRLSLCNLVSYLPWELFHPKFVFHNSKWPLSGRALLMKTNFKYVRNHKSNVCTTFHEDGRNYM